MHDQTDLLVDHEQSVVGMHDVERNRLGLRFDGGFELGLKRDLLAALYPHAGLGLAPAYAQRAGIDPGAQAAARELRHELCGGLIQAAAGELGRDR